MVKDLGKEDKIVVNNEYLQELYANTPHAIVIFQVTLDENRSAFTYEISNANKAFFELFDLSEQALTDFSITDFLVKTHIKENEFFALLEDVYHGEKHLNFDIFASEQKRYFNLTIFKSKDNTIAFVIKDSTARAEALNELRLSEKRYRTLVETTKEAVFISDLAGNIIFANKNAEKMLGYSQAQLRVFKINKLSSQKTTGYFFDNLDKLLTEGLKNFETQLMNIKGEKIWVVINASIISEDDQTFIYSFVHDISKHKENEKNLQSKKNALKKLNLMAISQGKVNEYQSLIELILQQLLAETNAVFAAFSEFDQQSKQLHVTGIKIREDLRGVIQKQVDINQAYISVPFPQEIYDQVVASVIYLDDFLELTQNIKIKGLDQQLLNQLNLQQYLVLPHLVENELYGVTVLGLCEENLTLEQDFIESFAQIAAISLKRKQTEKDLMIRESNHRSILEHLSEVVLRINKINEITFITSNIEQLLQYTVSEIRGKNLTGLIYPADWPLMIQALDQVLAKTEVKPFEIRLISKEKHPIWVSISLRAIEDSNQVTEIQGVLTDISDKIKKERQIKLQQKKIKALHSVALAMATLQNEDEIYNLTAQSATKILDFKRFSISIKEQNVLKLKIDSEESAVKTMPVNKGIAGKTLYNRQAYLIKDTRLEKDALHKSYRSLISVPIGDFGVFQVMNFEAGTFDEGDLEIVEILIAHTTEALHRVKREKALIAAEERNRALIDAIPDLVFLFNKEEKIINYNAKAEHKLLAAAKNFINQPLAKFLPADILTITQKKLQEAFATRKPISYNYKVKIEGQEKYEDVRMIPFGEEKVLALVRDITEQAKAEQELKRIEWMLDRDNLKKIASLNVYWPQKAANAKQKRLNCAILEAVDEEVLIEIAKDILLLLGSSITIFDQKGEIVLNIIAAAYCQYLKQGVTQNSDINDYCFDLNVNKVIESGEEMEQVCRGGLSCFMAPILVNNSVQGVLSIAYNDPPTDQSTIASIAAKYNLNPQKLLTQAQQYETRPQYIIALAKEQLRTGAKLIASLIARKNIQKALQERETQYRQLFYASPIPLLQMDYSNALKQLNELNLSLSDLKVYLNQNKDFLLKLIKDVRVNDVNYMALQFYGFENLAEFQKNMPKIVNDNDEEHFFNLFLALWQGEKEYFAERTHLTRFNEEKQVQIFLSVVPGFEKTCSRVLISVIDITNRLKAEQFLSVTKWKLEKLHQSTLKMRLSSSLEEIYQLIIDTAESILSFRICVIDIVEGEYFVTKATSKEMPAQALIEKQSIKEGLAGKTLQEMKTFVIDDLWSNSEYNPKDKSFRSILSASIGDFGVFQAASDQKAAFNQEDVNLTEILLAHAEEAIKRVHYEKEIKHLSFHDGLTNLYNRHFFENQLLRLDTPRQLPLSIIMIDVNALKLINDTYGHFAGDRLLKKVAAVLREICRSDDIVARWGGDEFIILLPQTSLENAENIAKRIIAKGENLLVKGVAVSMSLGIATKENKNDNIYQLLALAEERMYNNKLLEGRKARNNVLKSILDNLQANSDETKEHLNRMWLIAQKIGQEIGLHQDEMERLELVVALHDIGKIVVSKKILNKKGALTQSEWDKVKSHPEVGYRIARSLEEIAHVANEILCHHERWDGKGYPRGLKQKNIPLLSRIAAIADAFEVMIAGRAYRQAITKEEALQELEKCAGNQFDPYLVKAFLKKVQAENDFETKKLKK